MSDTPRTDAAILTEPFQIRTLSFEVVHVEVAEQLERELTATKSQLARICQEGFGNDDTIGLEPADDYVLRKLAGLRADNAELIDRLREARESHLHASARDVHTIQQQAVELSKLEAEINQEVAENTNLRQSLHDAKKLAGQLAEAASKCRHDTQDGVIISAESFWNLKDALAAYESAKKPAASLDEPPGPA